MNDHADVAESIIRCEGLTFALANLPVNYVSLREARDLLKARLIKELEAAEARGERRVLEGDI